MHTSKYGRHAAAGSSQEGIASDTVDARLARMGDGRSTYEDGVISAANSLALACGLRMSMAASEPAVLLVERGTHN